MPNKFDCWLNCYTKIWSETGRRLEKDAGLGTQTEQNGKKNEEEIRKMKRK